MKDEEKQKFIQAMLSSAEKKEETKAEKLTDSVDMDEVEKIVQGLIDGKQK